MKVIVKMPGYKPVARRIENSLKALQAAVGGNIECVTVAEDAAVICNEEWRLIGMPLNCKLFGVEFGGPILFVGVAGEEFCDLSEAAAELFTRELKAAGHNT